MSAQLIDGVALAEQMREQVRRESAQLRGSGLTPRLVAVRIGEDHAAGAYARSQAREAATCEIDYQLVELPGDALISGALAVISDLNADPKVSGIMLHLPIPSHLDPFTLQQAISPAKDVEGVGAANLGLLFMGRSSLIPCTASAAMACLRSLHIPLEGRRVVVVGRSIIVGKPLAMLMLQAHATVTICHTRTKNLSENTRRAEIILVAAGVPGLIREEHVSRGAIVIDVGIHRVETRLPDGKTARKTVGDVQFDEVVKVASAITPVPGGVGPVTAVTLMANIVKALAAQQLDPRAEPIMD